VVADLSGACATARFKCRKVAEHGPWESVQKFRQGHLLNYVQIEIIYTKNAMLSSNVSKKQQML
jgi:hypothetical protein